MKFCKFAQLKEQLAGAADRARERAERRRLYLRYHRVKTKLATGEIPGYNDLMLYMDKYKIEFIVVLAFGFLEVQIATFPALVFDKDGTFIGRQFRYVSTHRKVGGQTENLLTNDPNS